MQIIRRNAAVFHEFDTFWWSLKILVGDWGENCRAFKNFNVIFIAFLFLIVFIA